MKQSLNLISASYLKVYLKALNPELFRFLKNLKSKHSFSAKDFEYYFIASSVFSSKIEGNSLDLNSFMRLRNAAKSRKKEVKEIEDLVDAYKFASTHVLNLKNFLKAHQILSQTLSIKTSERGKLRKTGVGVYDGTTGRPVYLAVEPEYLQKEITKLFKDISLVLKQKNSDKEIFYYASMVHLWLAMLHPFADGNGRAARLLEKWFLSSTLGKAAWSLNSEKYYWDNRPAYYKNIALGYNYYALHWDRCIPFLLMLPETLKQ